MLTIKELNEELEAILEEDEIINGLKLIPHGEKATKYFSKALEYFKNNSDKVKQGFINLPLSEI